MKNKKIHIVYTVIILIGVFMFFQSKKNKGLVKVSGYKIEYSKFSKEEKSIDINKADEREILKKGFTSKQSEGVIEYRKKMGYIENLDDLIVIKGIGVKTLMKIKERFYIDLKSNDYMKKRLNINSIEEKELLWLKLSKREISKLFKWKKQNGEIYSNLDLISILGKSRYESIKDRVFYSTY